VQDAYRQVKGRLDLAVTDLGPTQLKNIADPIRVYSLEVGEPAQAKPAPLPAPEKSAPPRLSMVVLPFANIGGDPEQEHFVDGVTESLTTDLSRIRGALVIARNTAFAYKGKRLDVQTIGRELNVRYVLEGSVQRVGNRMRVNVQLIDAETVNHLWAERFDKPLYRQEFRLFPAVLPAGPSGMPSRASRWIRPVCWWRPGANCSTAAAASGAPAQRHIARWIVMRRPLRVARERGASEGRYRPNDSKR
jgi:TolB-like protein